MHNPQPPLVLLWKSLNKEWKTAAIWWENIVNSTFLGEQRFSAR